MNPALKACLITALLLRAALALVTEIKPIFPANYYNDVRLSEKISQDMLKAWSSGTDYRLGCSPSQRAHGLLLAGFYRIAGHRPWAAKLVHVAISVLGIWAFFLLSETLFGPGPALISVWLLALWPSHAFFTSQSHKEGLVMALTYTSLGALLAAREPDHASRRATLGLSALVLLGFLRSSLMFTLGALLSASAALALVVRLRRRQSAFAPALALAAALAAPFLFKSSYAALKDGLLRADPVNTPGPAAPISILPQTAFSPRSISESRRKRQISDQEFALNSNGHLIQTQLFFGAEFKDWGDVLLFLPKSLFYVLFMPLPGLYPMDGNLGRALASGENLLILVVAVLALCGILRSRMTPGRACLLIFFIGMAVGSAFLEFDLGSAMRHRMLYLPALFPFAFLLGRRRCPNAGKRKVIEVLECGGPGGTGSQVLALCNALDPQRFEVALVYGLRPGADAQTWRAQAQGAAKAFFLPEFTREISLRRDLTALVKLYRLFRDEAPDVVHLHSSKAGALGRPAAWLAGVPLIFYSPHGYGFIQQDRCGARLALYRLVEAALSWIGTIIAVSPSEAALAAPLAWGREVETVRDAYLGAPPQGLTPHEGLLVGSCGRITAARAPDAWLNLAQRLTDSRNGLKCAWIGGGEEESQMRRHLENMNLSSKVTVTGWLEADQARERLLDLDVFVHYSRWDALPNAVLEAMAYGLPVVASDIPGCRDAVIHGETGFLAKDEVELLEFCHRLVDDPALRARLGEAGRRRVAECFSQPQALSRLQELYGAPSALI